MPGFFLEVREPTPEELAQLEATAGTLPPEWLAWADEPHRVLVGAESERVVAAVHLAVVGRGEGWIEGVRAVGGEDADAQDRLVDRALRVLDEYGAVVVRTAWPAGGRPEWLDRAGFGERARYIVHLAPEDLRPGRAQPLPPQQAGSACGRLSAVLRRHAGGLLPLGWRWRAFAPEMALGAAREGRLLTDESGGVALVLRRGPDRLVAALSSEAPAALVGAVRGEVGPGGRVVCFLPAQAEEAVALRGWAVHPWCPRGVVVYELTLRSG